MDAFITYDRLRSNAAIHETSSIEFRPLYNSLKEFIDKFTDANSFESAHLLLSSKEPLKSLTHVTSFGLPKIDFSNTFGVGFRSVYYSVKAGNVNKALDELDKNPIALLSIKWKFKFIDPITKRRLLNQESIPIIDERVSNSQIYVRLSQKKSTISPWFAFPFAEINDTNRSYIEILENALPFQFSKNSWRKWHLTKNGNWIPRLINGS